MVLATAWSASPSGSRAEAERRAAGTGRSGATLSPTAAGGWRASTVASLCTGLS